MTNAASVPTSSALVAPDFDAALERLIVTGDLSQFKPGERRRYYDALCASLGLNPLTRPFQYLTLSGRLTLYATKDATEQLRVKHGISVTRLERERDEDTYTVIAYGEDARGRKDVATGVVASRNLAGDALANAKMKAETKAKRRLTLSLAGLGALDESEIETTGGHRVTVDHETGEIVPPSPRRGAPLTPEALLGGAVTVETGVEPGDRAPAPPEPVSGAPGADPAPADPPPSDLELGLARSAAVAAMDRLKLTPSERAYLIKQHAKVERLEAASLDGVNVLLDALQKVRPKSG